MSLGVFCHTLLRHARAILANRVVVICETLPVHIAPDAPLHA